jgi:hypothetical protein
MDRIKEELRSTKPLKEEKEEDEPFVNLGEQLCKSSFNLIK